MRRNELNYIVIALLAVGSLYLLISGLIMEGMGLHRFAFHSQVGYAWVVLAVVHLFLSWGRVSAYWGHRWKKHQPHAKLTTPSSECQESTPSAPVLRRGRRSCLLSVLAGAGGFMGGRLVGGFQVVKLPSSVTDVGRFYHQWSRIGAAQALGALLKQGEQPERYKTYPQAKKIKLPSPDTTPGLSLETAIETRRSRRDYTDTPLSLVNLSHLLHLAAGITSREQQLRAAPSAGALYPLEVYVVVHRVQDLPTGIYHYAVLDHSLEQLFRGDFRAAMVAAGLGQNFLGQASVCLILSAIWQRTYWKYRSRSYRYVLLEAGHLAQNFYLAATSLGLGACAVGAFIDEALNKSLGLEPLEEEAVYLLAVGPTTT